MPIVSAPLPDAPTLHWCVGRSRTTATWSAVHEQSWSAFIHWLKPDEPASSKEVRPYVGGTLLNGRRTIRTMEQRFFLTLDADYADPDFPMETELLFHDVPYLIHTTWRHDPNAHRYRLIVPLDRGVTPNEHKELAWLVMDRLGGEQFDKTTAQAERFMWGPSSQDPDTYYWRSAHARAPYLAVDAWLDGRHSPSQTRTGHGGASGPPKPAARRSEALSASAEDIERAEEILAAAVDDVLHLEEREEFAGRNEAVFHLLPLLLRFADAGALDVDLVLDSLFNATQQVPAEEPYTRQEFDASVRSARAYADEEGPILPETTRTKLALEDFKDIGDLDDLWVRTPQLKHIAQAADSLGRNRLALLAVVLTRILVEVDPGVCLPGVEDGAIASRAPINLGVALIGASGQGKTTFADKSAEVLGVAAKKYVLTPSTGQGLIQAYLEWDADNNENRLIADPKRLFMVDEIDKLGALTKDQGSTLMAELRTLLSGGTTGSTNARRDLSRMLYGGTYNFQLVLGVQPSRAEPLLSGREAGTPQRFIWVEVTDPKTALHPDERPEWPGPLDWNDAFMLEFELGSPVVDYPEWLKAELRDYDYKVSLETSAGGEMSRFGHQNLLRLKVAAGIAFLHESSRIDDEHVEMADQIIRASRRVQLDCERAVAEITFLKKKSVARSEERVSEEVSADKMKRLMKNARTKLVQADGDWVQWYLLRPAHRDREMWGEALWEALAHDEEIEVDEQKVANQTNRKARLRAQ
jgi:hypothetical protein